MPNTNNISDDNSFQHFFHGWLGKQQIHQNQLITVLLSSQDNLRREQELNSLVAQVLSHHEHYYEVKARAATQDVFILFSPPWLSVFERTFLWIAGYKPGLAFKTLGKSLGDELTAEQVGRVGKLKTEISIMEKTLNGEMIRIQESVAGPTWVQISRRRWRPATDAEMDRVVETIKNGLRDLVVTADDLRMSTLNELIKILNPVQAAKFLTATAQLHFRIRAWGLQRDENVASLVTASVHV